PDSKSSARWPVPVPGSKSATSRPILPIIRTVTSFPAAHGTIECGLSTQAGIGAKTGPEKTLLTFTNVATASDGAILLTDFEPFMTETANGVVLVRDPGNSSSTTSFIVAPPTRAP